MPNLRILFEKKGKALNPRHLFDFNPNKRHPPINVAVSYVSSFHTMMSPTMMQVGDLPANRLFKVISCGGGKKEVSLV